MFLCQHARISRVIRVQHSVSRLVKQAMPVFGLERSEPTVIRAVKKQLQSVFDFQHDILTTLGKFMCFTAGVWLVCWLAGWLVVCWLVGWLVGWQVGWLVGRLVGWCVGWQVGWLAGWLVGVLVGRLVGWQVGWCVGW